MAEPALPIFGSAGGFLAWGPEGARPSRRPAGPKVALSLDALGIKPPPADLPTGADLNPPEA